MLLLGYFNWFVDKKEQIVKDGQLVVLELAPVDPRSLMQGDYMRLNYQEALSDLINEQTAKRGYAILKTDSNQVAHVVRLQKTRNPISEQELAIEYKLINRRLFLGAESFFFEEGHDSLYQHAIYAGLKVNDKGESLLIGLYDKNHYLLQPQK